jgi:hypothetical protein
MDWINLAQVKEQRLAPAAEQLMASQEGLSYMEFETAGLSYFKR